MAKYDLTFKLAVIETYLNGGGYLIIGSLCCIQTVRILLRQPVLKSRTLYLLCGIFNKGKNLKEGFLWRIPF